MKTQKEIQSQIDAYKLARDKVEPMPNRDIKVELDNKIQALTWVLGKPKDKK